jgi:hypothetical protein
LVPSYRACAGLLVKPLAMDKGFVVDWYVAWS